MIRGALLTICAVLTVSSAVWSQNLLVNASFETGTGSVPADPSGWVEYGPSLTGEQSAAYARTGVYSAKRWTYSDNQESGYYQDFPAYAWDTYSASAYLYSPASDALSGSSFACIRLEFYDVHGNRLLQQESSRLQQANSGFGQFSAVAVAPEGTAHGRIVFAVGAGASPHGGAAYCDDADAGMVSTQSLTNDAFLDLLQHKIFDFFWNEASPLGLIKDRANDFHADTYSVASIASVGFGLPVICMAENKGWIDQASAHDRIATTLLTFRDQLYNYHGFFYHFVDMNTGQPEPGSEISTIDTALLVYGALFAGEYFQSKYGDPSLMDMAEAIYERVDWPAMYGGSSVYSEYMMMDILAMGSPAHPIAPSAWSNMVRPYRDDVATRTWDHSYPRFFYPPLFVHQYPQCYLDFRFRRDPYTANFTYFTSSRNNTRSNRQYCIDHSAAQGIATPKFQTYGQNCWGLTAADGPYGYFAYGEADPALPEPQGSAGIDGTVMPHAAGGSVMFAPEICIPALRYMRETFGSRVWGRYGFSDAFNVDLNWWDQDVIGIDLGSMFLSIENYRTGAPWRYSMLNTSLRRGLQLAGFVDKPQASFDDFDSGPPNAWGGLCDAPRGTGTISYVSIPAANAWVGGRARRITGALPGDGGSICLNSLNACYDDQITFWVRGDAGGEQITAVLKDSANREFSVAVGPYLPSGGITGAWQMASIPLAAFGAVHLTSLASISFLFAAAPGAIGIDYLAFTGVHPDAGVMGTSTIAAAQSAPSGVGVILSGVVVTENYGGFFYVEQPDRAAGIRVGASGAYSPGDVLQLEGDVQDANGERTFVPSKVTVVGRQAPLAALAMEAGQVGYGLPDTVGMLVRSWGVVSSTSASGFTLNDGSGRALTVVSSSLTQPPDGVFAVVTGAVGAIQTPGGRQPILRVQSAAGIQTVP